MSHHFELLQIKTAYLNKPTDEKVSCLWKAKCVMTYITAEVYNFRCK